MGAFSEPSGGLQWGGATHSGASLDATVLTVWSAVQALHINSVWALARCVGHPDPTKAVRTWKGQLHQSRIAANVTAAGLLFVLLVAGLISSTSVLTGTTWPSSFSGIATLAPVLISLVMFGALGVLGVVAFGFWSRLGAR